MWKLGDIVTYGAAGICSISDIRDEKFGGEIKKYFILKPIFDDKNTFFVPSFNEGLMSKIRSVMTKEEALALIRRIPSILPNWIDHDKLRQDAYKEILDSGDRDGVVAVMKALQERREMLYEKGKKLRTSDEMILRHAEMLIENECAHVLDMTRTYVRELIKKSPPATDVR